MRSDPIVEEVRQVRREIEQACRDDPGVFYQHVVKVQQSFASRLVRLAPKPTLVSVTPKNGLPND